MRSFVAFCMVGGALCVWGDDYTVASYVQDGLVAQWDGFDNAGTGAHDVTATTWKNLKTSGGDLQLSGCSWGLGGVVINTVGSPLVCTETFSPTLEAGAKLTVDATAYEGKTARWPLVRLGASTPSLTTGDSPVFASGDVTVLGDDVRLVEGTYRGVNALWAVFDRGAVLLVR